MVDFTAYTKEYYQGVCDFLTELNAGDKHHINWNWARFEWMYEHPEFDNSLIESIGLWTDQDRVVGAAIYDMYFGEGFCGALPGYGHLYPEILEYAYRKLSDESGFAFAVCDDDTVLAEIARHAGFEPTEQYETMMRIDLDRELAAELPEGFEFAELDPAKELYEFLWLLWQGFDHGDDRAEFERENGELPVKKQLREHFNPYLSVSAADGSGEKVAYCCLWYSDATDYAYVEPVCTVPSFRGKGISKAVIYEALRRARSLGAKYAYVISDMEFYRRLGFEEYNRFTFWRKD